MNVFKLSNRSVVVSEGGVSKVLTPPSGVNYNEKADRWNTWVLDANADWVGKSFGCKTYGIVEAFELAVQAREESLTFLLNRRMLPRIRHLMRPKPDHSRSIAVNADGKFVVRDPLRKNYHQFLTKEDAEKFNVAVTEEWKLEYKFDKLSMIRIDYTFKQPKAKLDKFASQFQATASQLGFQY